MPDITPVVKLINPPGTGPILRSDQGSGAGAARDFINFQKDNSEVFSVDVSGLPDPGGGDAKREAIVVYGDVPADADALEPFLMQFTSAVVITNIYVAVDTDTADGSTNKQSIAVLESGADDTLCTLLTPAENPGLAQNTWTTMGAVSNGDIAAADYLYVTFTKTSSGLILSGLAFKIEYTLGG